MIQDFGIDLQSVGIAMLLVKILQQRSTFGWALSNLIALLRWNLFTYRNLWEWIKWALRHPAGDAGRSA
jgi:hypothetical protein